MKHILYTTTLILLFTFTLEAQIAVKKEIFSKAGKIILVEHHPEGFVETKKYPLLIIVPDYKGMDEDMINSIASGAKRLGFFVVRFNFSTKNNKPSKTLKPEVNTLVEVTKLYSAKRFINKNNVNVLAKGFGSRILVRTKLNTYNSLGLLNPLCDKKYSFSRSYGPFIKSKKSNLIAMNVNNGFCKTNTIYSSLGRNKNAYVQVFKGSSKTLNEDTDTKSVMALSIMNWLSAKTKN